MSRRIGGRAAGRPGGRTAHGTPALRPGYAASPTGDPFAGVERVYIDGNNLLHALARGGPPGPAGAVVGRIRAAFPPSVVVDLVFDGPPAGGISRLRLASRRYLGGLPLTGADDGVGRSWPTDRLGRGSWWSRMIAASGRGPRMGARNAGAWINGRMDSPDRRPARVEGTATGRWPRRSRAGRAAPLAPLAPAAA
jgi:hypothetical protein